MGVESHRVRVGGVGVTSLGVVSVGKEEVSLLFQPFSFSFNCMAQSFPEISHSLSVWSCQGMDHKAQLFFSFFLLPFLGY
jgi:hypothetical protein